MTRITRTLQTAGGKEVVLWVEPPFLAEGERDWQCACGIDGLVDPVRKTSWGVDGAQAVLLAFAFLATKLYTSKEYEEEGLTWLEMRNLGLPVPETMRDMVPPAPFSSGF